MPIDDDPVLKRIAQRQYEFVGIDNAQHFSFRVGEYRGGQMHPIHTDTYEINGSVLIVTALIYITDVEQGGVIVEGNKQIRNGATLNPQPRL